MFFLFFSLMVTHAMGKDTVSFLVYQPAIEHMEGEDGSGKDLTSEPTDCDQEFTLNELTSASMPTKVSSVIPTDINFQYQYTRSCWEPPKIS